MITPTEWKKNIKNKFITEEMLDAALWSVNKRAKNCRDQKRLYAGSFYNTDAKYQEKEDEYYSIKDSLLKFVDPVAVHIETFGFQKLRHFDYEEGFADTLIRCLCSGKIIWTNCFRNRNDDDYDYDYDYDYGYEGNLVYFFDEAITSQPKVSFYKFYVIGNHSYHTPISKEEAEIIGLPVISIGRIETEGHDISDLCSTQFVKKVVETLQEGNYKIEENKARKKWLEESSKNALKCHEDYTGNNNIDSNEIKYVNDIDDFLENMTLSQNDIEENYYEASRFWRNDILDIFQKRVKSMIIDEPFDLSSPVEKEIYDEEREKCDKAAYGLIMSKIGSLQELRKEVFNGKKLGKHRRNKLKNRFRNITNPDRIRLNCPNFAKPIAKQINDFMGNNYLNYEFRSVQDVINAWKEYDEKDGLSSIRKASVRSLVYDKESDSLIDEYYPIFEETVNGMEDVKQKLWNN